jgi:DNA recombination-dependent growth factor C
MGAFDGSLSFKTFFVDGEPPADYYDDYLARATKHRFVDLDPEQEEERRIGWVCIDQPLDTHFDRHRVFFNQYVALGLRIDRWALPTPWLKAMIKEATRDFMAKNDVPKLGRREKDNIKAVVQAQLRARVIPAMKVVDMVWDIHSRVVRFWSNSDTLGEEFQALFEDTFGLNLKPDSPYTAAAELQLGEKELDALVQLEPAWLVDIAEYATPIA